MVVIITSLPVAPSRSTDPHTLVQVRYSHGDSQITTMRTSLIGSPAVLGIRAVVTLSSAVPSTGTLMFDDYVYDEPIWAECVLPATEILASFGGDTVLAKDLQEGDDIVYYNFETQEDEVGKVYRAFVHENAAEFVRYEFEDGTYVEVTDYHPIYTKEGWKSLTQRSGYPVPEIGDEVKTPTGWKKISKIETWEGVEDCYNFIVITETGEKIYNYYGNGTLLEGPTKFKDMDI